MPASQESKKIEPKTLDVENLSQAVQDAIKRFTQASFGLSVPANLSAIDTIIDGMKVYSEAYVNFLTKKGVKLGDDDDPTVYFRCKVSEKTLILKPDFMVNFREHYVLAGYENQVCQTSRLEGEIKLPTIESVKESTDIAESIFE